MIAGPYPEDSRIVTTWLGRQTGDVVYQTADGNIWQTTYSGPSTITGVSYGSVVGDRIVSPPRPSFGFRRPPTRKLATPFLELDTTETPQLTRVPRARPRPAVCFVGAGAMHRRWR